MEKERVPWFLDETTGFPLPLMPLKDAPDVFNKDGTPYHTDPDEHHFWFPRKAFNASELKPGGEVVRISRLQTVRRYHHNTAHKMMEPPPIVTERSGHLRLSLLALSNYVPRQAIDVRGEAPEVVVLSDSEYHEVCNTTRKGFGSSYHSVIGRFFLGVMLEQSAHVVEPKICEEFLYTKNLKRKRDLGNRALKAMAHNLVIPVTAEYAELRKAGEIPQQQPSPFATVLRFSKLAKPHHALQDGLRVA
jgi:hypothetical protein